MTAPPPPTTCLLVSATSLLTLLTPAGCGRVVFIPSPYASITLYHSHVARALAELGHQVWMTLPSYLSHKGYLDMSGLGVIPYESVPGLEDRYSRLQMSTSLAGEAEDAHEVLRMQRDVLDNLLYNASLLEVIRDKEPDLIVLNSHPRFYASAVIPYKLGKPFAFLGAVYHAPGFRVPFSPAETPVITLPYSNRMTFWQRLRNTLAYVQYVDSFVGKVNNPSVQQAVAVWAPELPYLPLQQLVGRAEVWLVETDHVLDYPRPTLPNVKLIGGIATGPAKAVAVWAPELPYLPLQQLVGRAEVWLVETDHVLDYPRPTLPNVKLIGGIATGPAKPLLSHLQAFMDSATEGVVIVTFGTYVLSLPPAISDKLFQALLQLPLKSVVRSDQASPNPGQILTSHWLPQNDLLGHRHTRVFVSHCGTNSLYDALYHAVPVLALPLRSDQPYNAKRAQLKGLAEVLDLRSCSVAELSAAILKLAREPCYRLAAQKNSRLYRQQFGNPRETAAFWLDHVMEFGGDYMRSAGQQMSWYQFLLLDVLAFLLGCVVVSVVALYCCTRLLWRRLVRRVLNAKVKSS